MSEPFLAEIRMVGFNFAPQGWAFCDGQLLPINQNQSLFSLLGTTYGGDGMTNFALPDLRGRTPIHRGASNGPYHAIGESAGAESHSLGTDEMPQHSHAVRGSSGGADTPIPQDNVLAAAANLYAEPADLTELRAGSITEFGGGQAHDNVQPYLALRFCIALQGIFPSRN